MGAIAATGEGVMWPPFLITAFAASRRERDAAEHLGEARRLDGGEAFACRKANRRQVIGDRNQLVRVGALVTTAADGRGNGPDRHRAVAIHPAGQIAKPISRW